MVIAKTFNEAEKAKLTIDAEWQTNKEWNYSDIASMIEVGKGQPQAIQNQEAHLAFLRAKKASSYLNIKALWVHTLR